jgi:hypothetical protein
MANIPVQHTCGIREIFTLNFVFWRFVTGLELLLTPDVVAPRHLTALEQPDGSEHQPDTPGRESCHKRATTLTVGRGACERHRHPWAVSTGRGAVLLRQASASSARSQSPAPLQGIL